MSVQPNIDRGSHVPYYLQLKEVLTEGIRQGDWGPGDLIPSEAELGKSFGVSRTVVRQALNEMTYDGLVVRQKGKGTFVTQPKISSRSLVQSLEGFYGEMAERGVPVLTQVLEQTLEPADSDIAANLELEAMAPVVKLVRLRFVEEEPIVLVESHLPYEMCRGQVHLRKFNSPTLGGRMYALRKTDLKSFQPRSQDVCRIENGSTNAYLLEDRAIEEFLKTVEPRYTAAVAKLAADDVDTEAIYAVARFVAYVISCSPAGLRIRTEPQRKTVEVTVRALDAAGEISVPPYGKICRFAPDRFSARLRRLRRRRPVDRNCTTQTLLRGSFRRS